MNCFPDTISHADKFTTKALASPQRHPGSSSLAQVVKHDCDQAYKSKDQLAELRRAERRAT